MQMPSSLVIARSLSRAFLIPSGSSFFEKYPVRNISGKTYTSALQLRHFMIFETFSSTESVDVAIWQRAMRMRVDAHFVI